MVVTHTHAHVHKHTHIHAHAHAHAHTHTHARTAEERAKDEASSWRRESPVVEGLDGLKDSERRDGGGGAAGRPAGRGGGLCPERELLYQ